MGQTNRILIGFLAGIICGLFFGESCSVFKPFASGFVKLLQVTVLPFIVVNLISGIGSLRQDEAKNIAFKSGLVMLLFWALGIASFFSMQLAFPPLSRPTFFSASNITGVRDLNLIDVFIPSNPFHSLSEGLIPSIVLFCLLLGVALIGIEKNRMLMDPLSVLSQALSRVNRLIQTIVPLGIFVVIASTAGTITLDRLLELQVFLISLLVICVLLAALVLPLITSGLTPFSYRELLSIASRPVILGLTTGNDFVTLPLIVDGVQSLFKKHESEETVQKARVFTEVLAPLAYSFPSLGAFVALFFVIFTATPTLPSPATILSTSALSWKRYLSPDAE